MKNSCTFVPSRGKELFKSLRKDFEYSLARKVFLQAIHPSFIKDYKKSLTLDSEGIPTYDSVMKNKYIQKVIGQTKMLNILNKPYPPLDDTRVNFINCVQEAMTFNTTNENRDDYVAFVDYTEEDQLKVVVKPKSEETIQKFNEQFGTYILNERISNLFRNLGITIEDLTKEEVAAGRVGLTDFNKARNIATSFTSMVKLANNMEGALALSEEFSHLLIGAFRKSSLVQRNIESLSKNEDSLKEILGNEYQDTVEYHEGNMSLVAEEALGKLLQKHLIQKTGESTEEELPPQPSNKSLFQRLINWLIAKFKGYNPQDIQEAINYADSSMSTMARKIIEGTQKVTKEDIEKSQRNVQFNALSNRVERNINILKEAMTTETKRYKLYKTDKSKAKAEKILSTLGSYTTENANTIEGLLKYGITAVNRMKSLYVDLETLDAAKPDKKYKTLRKVRSYIQSYGTFIKQLNEAANQEAFEVDNQFMERLFIDANNPDVSLKEILDELNTLSQRLTQKFSEKAFPAMAEFLAPYMGEEIIVPFGKYAGSKISVESLLHEAPEDISFMDLWLDSMANSSDLLLQLFDKAVKEAKDVARLQSINDIKRIQLLREEYEKKGITNFDWIFETNNGHKTGNYISAVNRGEFQEDYDNFMKSLEEEYGKNPTGTKAIEKLSKRKEWLKENALREFGIPMPNPTKYRNRKYDALTTTQKEFLEKFLNLKQNIEAYLPPNRTDRLKAIQRRRPGSQRLLDMMASPTTVYENIKEYFAESLLDREDDDSIFGDVKNTKGLTDFAGNEFMLMPVLYTNRLKNPDELDTDIFGSLMAYAYSTNQYKELNNIVDALEVGRSLVIDGERKIVQTRGDKVITEKIEGFGVNTIKRVMVSQSNTARKLDEFMESQVYQRYLKDQGTFFGTNINTNKLASFLLKWSSLAQLGLNFLANSANVATGVCMQNIEAVTGQFFKAKDLLKADKEYGKHIIEKFSELGKRTKTNKLDLVFELFDIKQDYESVIKRVQKRNILQRLFGAEVAFIGQYAGDHWLYGRTAIAMCLTQKVLLNNKEMSLWDALQVKDFLGSNSVKELNYRDIKNLDGTDFNVKEFGRKIAALNHQFFGIYNQDDASAANRVAQGRLLLQYRKWMKPQFNRRFQATQRNLTLGTWEEGYYRTFLRVLNQLRRGEIQLGSWKEDLTQEEIYNVRRAITEMAQLFAVFILAKGIDWPDDKDRPFFLKYAEYSAKRLLHEIGGLAPSPIMMQELLKTLTNPIPSGGALKDLINLTISALDPTDWTDEMKSGPYKGLSTLEKNFIKAPLPGVAQYKQINRFTTDIDTSIQYYMRPN